MSAFSNAARTIDRLLNNAAIETHFQPIVSVRRQALVGVEALSRGIDGNGRLIPPTTLFDLAHAAQQSAALDHLCYTVALESFARVQPVHPEVILFLNLAPASIDQGPTLADNLLTLCRRLNLEPRNIALEISEAEVSDLPLLQRVVARCRELSFLVVLDDLGKGFSNLDRIALIRPDILKADRTLLHGLHHDYHKQEVLRSLINMSDKIGGWLIAEGIEKQAEALVALELAADLFQGFYFAAPTPATENAWQSNYTDPLKVTGQRFKRATLQKLQVEHRRRIQRHTLTQAIALELSAHSTPFEERLRHFLSLHLHIEAGCVLDATGRQVSETIYGDADFEPQKALIFRPSAPGASHAFKEYYYAVMETTLNPFETAPYVPLPSGRLCVTVTTTFQRNTEPFVLCLHFRLDLP